MGPGASSCRCCLHKELHSALAGELETLATMMLPVGKPEFYTCYCQVTLSGLGLGDSWVGRGLLSPF